MEDWLIVQKREILEASHIRRIPINWMIFLSRRASNAMRSSKILGAIFRGKDAF
jgi:hypothetical protein